MCDNFKHSEGWSYIAELCRYDADSVLREPVGGAVVDCTGLMIACSSFDAYASSLSVQIACISGFWSICERRRTSWISEVLLLEEVSFLPG